MYAICTKWLAFGVFLVTATGVCAQVQPEKRDNDNDPPPKMGLLRDVGISADGKLAFAGDSERNIWVWDVAKRELVRVISDPFTSHNTHPRFAFSADGKFAVVGNETGDQRMGWGIREPDHERLTFWDLAAGKKLRAFEMKDESVYAVALSPDGKWALSASIWKLIPHPDNAPLDPAERGRAFKAFPMCILRLWDTSTGKIIRSLGDDGGFGHLAFSHDGQFIVSPYVGPKPPLNERQTWILRKWHTARTEDLGAKTMAGEWSPMSLGFFRLSPGGRRAVIASEQGVSLWNLETGKLVWNGSFQDDRRMTRDGFDLGFWPFTSAAFSPDGKRIAAAGGAGTTGRAFMIDAETGKKTPGFLAANGCVGAVSFTPHGDTLLGASGEGLRFWDARTGKTLFTLKD